MTINGMVTSYSAIKNIVTDVVDWIPDINAPMAQVPRTINRGRSWSVLFCPLHTTKNPQGHWALQVLLDTTMPYL